MTDEPAVPPPPIDGRTAPEGLTRRRLLGAAGAGLASAALAACSSGPRSRPPTTSRPAKGPTTTIRPAMRIGYVTEATGPNAFRGEMVTASLKAFRGYVDNKLGGSYLGVKLELIPADAPTGRDAPAAYASLVDNRVDAIMWATPAGLTESKTSIATGNVPVISVFADAAGPGADGQGLAVTGAGSHGSPLFQTALTDAAAIDVMLAYAKEDRGFSTAALVVDTADFPHVGGLFVSAAAKHGLTNQGVIAFDSTVSHADLAVRLDVLKQTGTHVVVCYALADQTSIVATQLATLDAKYVNTPTTLRSHFKPMLMGPVWGTGDPNFASLAGSAAARGTLSATLLSSIMTLPTWPVRKWIRDYVPTYNNGMLRGGENAPADAVAVLLEAASRADSTHSAAVVAALEKGAFTGLASGVGVSFAPDRHLAVTTDDVALLSLDFPPEPYNLGSEWKDILPDSWQGPTHLVDFTLAANTRSHPQLMADILQRRYGISATDSYQGGDSAKVAACKMVH